jgi:hypothetical protein
MRRNWSCRAEATTTALTAHGKLTPTKTGVPHPSVPSCAGMHPTHAHTQCTKFTHLDGFCVIRLAITLGATKMKWVFHRQPIRRDLSGPCQRREHKRSWRGWCCTHSNGSSSEKWHHLVTLQVRRSVIILTDRARHMTSRRALGPGGVARSLDNPLVTGCCSVNHRNRLLVNWSKRARPSLHGHGHRAQK